MHSTVLIRHPDFVADAVEKIGASVAWNNGAPIAIRYSLKGDLTRLRVPQPQPPRRSDRLWEHTCFEAFFAVQGRPEYLEFNFSPSGEWAVFSFQRYREPAPPPKEDPAPELTVRCAGESLELNARVGLAWLGGWQALSPGARVSVALSTVIEDNRGRLSYWALKHPPGKPDFHHRDGFALEIEHPAKTRRDRL
jgi:hypothetical protein